MRVHNDILKAVDDNKYVFPMFLNLSAAFDTVDHKILLSRLANRFGIRDTAPNSGFFHIFSHVSSSFLLMVLNRQWRICNTDYHRDPCWVLYCIRFTQVHWVI